MTFTPSIGQSPDDDEEHDDCFLPSHPQTQSQPQFQPEIHTFHANAAAAPSGFYQGDTGYHAEQDSTTSFERKVHHAQHELNTLRQQRDHVIQQKQAWQQIHERRSKFQEERRDLMDRLSRSIVEYEEGAAQAVRQADAMNLAADSFRRHLAVIETIHPENWNDDEIHLELSRAQSIMDEALDDYSSAVTKISSLGVKGRSSLAKSKLAGNYVQSLRSGLLSWLPLLILGIVAAVLIATALSR
mgnify:CR=1 FL=1|tara:strand:- start:19939 stop:20667 length:729 start_codon:yes stop_codon:yes gene_type:complete